MRGASSSKGALPLAALAALCTSACNTAPEVTALFEVPTRGQPLEQGFYSLPYPNDLRLLEDGRIDLTGIPRPNALLEDYLGAIAAKQYGFGTSAGIYLRFDGSIDPGTLPVDPSASQSAEASVYLVNVDVASPTFGQKMPLEFRFAIESGENIGEHSLGCLPFPGFVMAEKTTYALVVTNRLRSMEGTAIRASNSFQGLMERSSSSDPAIARAQQVYQPLTGYLDQAGGDERSDVVNAAVFTTQDATSLLGRFREVIHDQVAVPSPRDMTLGMQRNEFALYLGRYDSPLFQSGEFPYNAIESGGGFELDAMGLPIVQSTHDMRFSLSLPTQGTMPASGWPVVLYAHGTGGDYLSFQRNNTALRLALQGIAVLSIDQVMHGDRLSSGSSDTLFFNFLNPLAARGNVMQSALENFQLARLARAFDFVDANAGDRPIRFDSTKMAFFGHSQGSLTGLPFVAMEPNMKGAVFSGAGALLYLTMLHKTLPFDIPSIVQLIIRDEPLDRFNPALALLQAFFEPADSAGYAHLLATEPPEGNQAKNLFLSQGLTDRYTPIPNIEALATAMKLDIASPQRKPVAGLVLQGTEVLALPITNNAGNVTTVLAQYDEAAGSDGHFVVFDIAAARQQSVQFLKTLFDTGKATVVAP